MIIIAGHELVDASKRQEVVERFGDLVARARAADGCIHVAITADSIDEERIDVIEVWRDARALEVWRAQAGAPDADEIRFADVRRYEAQDGGPLFP